MKKFTVLFLAGLLILAFGATASAQAPKLEFKASGFIDTQTFLGVNVPQYLNNPQGNAAFWLTPFISGLGPIAAGPPVFYGTVNPAFAVAGGAGKGGVGFNRQDAHWESRAHLKFDAIMGPNLSGTLAFEIDDVLWGNGPGAQGNQITDRNSFGYWSSDRAAVEVKNPNDYTIVARHEEEFSHRPCSPLFGTSVRRCSLCRETVPTNRIVSL